MAKKTQGSVHILLIIAIALIALLALSAGAYYMLYGKGNPSYMQYVIPTPTPVSESDDTSTIESELNATDGASPDKEIEELDYSASGL